MKSLASVLNELAFQTRLQAKVATLAALVFLSAAHAAEPLVQWAKVVGGAGHDWPEALAFALDGQVYLAGDVNQKVLHRFDQNGTLLGTQASRGEYIRGVTTDSAGNYYLTGLIRDSKRLGVGRTNDFYLAKYSSADLVIWERTGGTLTYSNIYPWNLGGFKVALDPAGNIYVAGGSTGPAVFGGVAFPTTAGGPLLCKYAPDGTLLWVKRVEGAFNGISDGGTAQSIALTSDGGIVISGFLHNGEADFGGMVVVVAGPYSSDSFVAKFNSAGDVQWVRLAHGGDGVATDTSGNIYCVGTIWVNGEFALHCGKFNPAGDLVWERSVFGAASRGIALEGKGEPVFLADLYATVQLDDLLVNYNGLGNGWNIPEALVCKADATGRFQWAITEIGAGSTQAGSVLCDRVGNLYVAGALGCGWTSGGLVCSTGMLGSFPLEMLFPNGDNKRDVFIARLFDAEAVVPELKIAKSPAGLALTWPVEATNFVLEAATSLPAVSWTAVTNIPTVTTNERSVQLPLTSNAMFFRMKKR